MANWITVIATWILTATVAFSAEVSHGPIVGHTTDRSTRIWVRASEPCNYRVRLTSPDGDVLQPEPIMLSEEDNFCGTVVVNDLAPQTTYRYDVLLDDAVVAPKVQQTVTTYVQSASPSRVRIGFGHSLRGPGDQTTWQAIADQELDLFILMGDNIYSNTTEPAKHREIYLRWRADPHFLAFAATTPIYAVWDDHDYGTDNSDRTQPGKTRSLKTFNEIWPNPESQAGPAKGIWTKFTVGPCEFFLLDVRYHRSPDDEPDGPAKTMLGVEQRDWFTRSLAESDAVFKFPVSGSSWNCGGVESWNHAYASEYNRILTSIRQSRTEGVILLGGDQHNCKIGVRPRESWKGYDLHEWMAGQVWNRGSVRQHRGFGVITVDSQVQPPTAQLAFVDEHGEPRTGTRIPYTTPGALRALWNSPRGVVADAPRAVDGEIRRSTLPLWDALPRVPGETLTIDDVRFPKPE